MSFLCLCTKTWILFHLVKLSGSKSYFWITFTQNSLVIKSEILFNILFGTLNNLKWIWVCYGCIISHSFMKLYTWNIEGDLMISRRYHIIESMMPLLPLLFRKVSIHGLRFMQKNGALASDESQWTFRPTRLVIFRDNLMSSQALVSWKPDWWEMVLSSDLLSQSVVLFCYGIEEGPDLKNPSQFLFCCS